MLNKAPRNGRAPSRARGSFYGKQRIARTNEQWDTLDGRLIVSLVEAMPGLRERMVWEPAAGCGMMVDQLENAGVRVYSATDITPRRDDVGQLDIFGAVEMMAGCDAIVTNPPWGVLAAPFVRKALELAQERRALVCMLVPVPWITGRKIADLTGSVGFEALIVPRYRARWMTSHEEAKLKSGAQAPKMNHVWAIWNFSRVRWPDPRILFVNAPDGDLK